MLFLAIFAHWVDTSKPGLEVIGPDDILDLRFTIKASSEARARKIASGYEGLEIHAHEGIGKLKSLTAVSGTPENSTSLKAFDSWLRPRAVRV